MFKAMEVSSIFINQIKRVLRSIAFYWLVANGVFVIFIIVAYRRYDNETKPFSHPVFTQEAEEILQQVRLEIEKEMEGYPYDVLSGRHIKNMTDLVMERGGNPIRSVIVSNWRSGSTFMGDLVSSHPASFYHYEPFFDLDQFRAPLSSRKPLTVLQSFFECHFSNLGDHLRNRKKIKWYIAYNRYLKKWCSKNASVCRDPEFLTSFCRLFPFQVTKIVALDVAAMSSFLENEELGVKIVFLVRDPRGIMHSRKDLDWCKHFQNCHNLTLVCRNAVSDYVTAMHFSRRYQKSFKVLRYEDLTSHPWRISKDIYSFYGINFHESVKEFLKSHTRADGPRDANPHSTFRNSKDAASQWREKLTFDEVEKIQKHCHEALRLWGYNFVTDSYHQRTVDPFIPLSTMNINYFQ